MKKYLLQMLLALVTGTNVAFATKIQVDCIWYDLNYESKTAEVTFVADTCIDIYSGTVIIPATIIYDGATYDVTKIGDNALQNRTNLTSIEIPNSVTSIGNNAFYGSTGLTFIEIPNSVTYIGYNAFYGCSSLTSMTIPNSVIRIGRSVFFGCTGLIFIEIPNSVTNIGDQAFYGCSSLTSVEIPNSVTNIGKSAFAGCSNLTSVTIPNSVTRIGESAFAGCSNLTSVKVEKDNLSFDSRNDCDAVIETESNTLIIGCKKTIIPNSVTSIGDRAFRNCFGLTSIEIPNSVTSIGEAAFCGCNGLNSIDIPNSVTYLGESAFDGCSQLKTFTIGTGVNFIRRSTFYSCSSLTSVIIPDNILAIDAFSFSDCSNLSSVTLGDSITGIGGHAFGQCNNLKTIFCKSMIPPTSYGDIFNNDTSLTTIFVPCFSMDAYQIAEDWSQYADKMKYLPLDHHIYTTHSDNGQVHIPTNVCDSLTAIPNYGYHFVRWSDGNTENPRLIELTQDTTIAAVFAIDKNGLCGKDNALKWTFDDKSKTLTITGEGDLTDNYTFGVEAPSEMTTLVLSNDVTSIGDSAFYGMTTINHLSIGSNVASIGNYAFAECKNFDDITCYATTVPTINETTFNNVGNKQYIYLFVLENRQRAYLRDTYWGEFDVQVKNAETVTEPIETVVVIPSDNTVEISWPVVDGAESYEISITKDGETVCTLIFNANGQLTGIAFAPARDKANKQQTEGFKFTVTGLTCATQYGYSIEAKNANNQTVDTKSGSFTTTGDVIMGIDQITNDQLPITNKVIKDGRLFILRGEKIYTLQGQQVR